jgi:outer membrane receptor protein involved in Fe transport
MSRLSAFCLASAVLVGLFAATPALSAPLQSEVRDSHGHPWKNRDVRLLSSDGTEVSTATTDAKGVARFRNVAPGKYIIEVPGTNGTVTRKEITVENSGNAAVSLVTDVKPESVSADTKGLAEVTVTGRRATQPGALRSDIVMTESVDADQMEKTGATSLTDALSHQPGIDIQVECSICNVRSITLDNLPGRFTTLTLDGVPIFSPVSNAYGLDMLGVNGLERIDVSRGAATSLATPESLGGTVTLVTKVPTQDEAEIDADGGNFGYRRETAYGAMVFDWGTVSVNGTNESHYSVDGIGYGISQFTGYHRDLEGVSLFVKDFLGFHIKTRYDHIEEKRGGGPLGDDYSAILANTTGNPFNWSAGPNGSPVPNTWVVPSTGQLLEPPYNGGEAGIAQIIFTTRNQFVETADRSLGDNTNPGLSQRYSNKISWLAD